MQAPEVTVVLRGTKYVTLKRRLEIFNVLMSGTGGQSDEEYEHVKRGYNLQQPKKCVGRLEVKMEAGWGACGVDQRYDSPVYRGLWRMMQEAGFMAEVNETEQWIRFVPQQVWREAKEDEEGSDGCIVTRAGRKCKYCEGMSMEESEETVEEPLEEQKAVPVLGQLDKRRVEDPPTRPDGRRGKFFVPDVALETRYGKMSLEEASKWEEWMSYQEKAKRDIRRKR
jgi:hypothetical protein